LQLVKNDPEVLTEVLTEIFNLIDANGDGHISEIEGKSLGLAMGESEEEAAESWNDMMRDMDDLGDRNGMVELEGATPTPRKTPLFRRHSQTSTKFYSSCKK
jgi:hypothetical protein